MRGLFVFLFGYGVCRCSTGVAFLMILLTGAPLLAVPIVPVSYVATPGEGTNEGGYFNYFDDTGSQLTDGVDGVNDWKADLGNGPAYEWVAWRVTNPVITFTFANPITLDRIGIDFNRDEQPLSQIFLPATVTINGVNFAVNPNAIPDTTRGTVFFNGSWTGTNVTVTLTDNDPTRWIFVDEVTFDAVSVPEPSALPLLTGGFGLFILAAARRDLNRRGRRERSFKDRTVVSFC